MSCLSVHPSAYVEQFGAHWMDIRKILHMITFQSLEKIQD